MKYFSLRQGKSVAISDMHTKHIENAIRKVESDTHSLYSKDNTVAIALRDTLLQRYRERMAILDRLISVQDSVIDELYSGKDPDYTGGTRYVPANTLADLRDLALVLCRRLGNVTADTLRKALTESGREVPGYALAYVFTDRRFKKIGFLRSTTPSNKGRFISVWTSAEAV